MGKNIHIHADKIDQQVSNGWISQQHVISITNIQEMFAQNVGIQEWWQFHKVACQLRLGKKAAVLCEANRAFGWVKDGNMMMAQKEGFNI